MNTFDVLFYSSPQPMWIFDVNTLYLLEVNEAAIAQYGFSKEEFLSKTIVDLRPTDEIPLLLKVLPTIRSTTTMYREFTHVNKAGKLLNVEIMSYPMVFNGIECRLVHAHNIEERKAMVKRLKFTQAKLDKILESTTIGFFQVNIDSVITYWNPAAEAIIGFNKEYILGRSIWDVFTELVDSDFYHKYYQAMNERVNVEFTTYFWPVQKWLSITAYPVVDGVIIHFKDITESKIYEEKLLEKIEQLKEVSYLNSHYIRRPVASLLGLTNLITTDSVTEKELKEVASHIQECTLELDTVVREINNKVNNDDYIDSLIEEVESFSLTGLIKSLIAEIKAANPSHKFVFKREKEISYYGNKHTIGMAINGLLTNAVKYSPDGKVVITSLEIIAGNIIISVKDSGIGMDQQTINQIFLSFNNKSLAKQWGRTLSKIADVMHKHNGNIWVESKPGKGSVFSMRLPLSNIAVFKNNIDIKNVKYRQASIEILYDKAKRCITADWNGFHSFHSVKSGCLKVLSAVIESKYHMILNDNTNVMGTWDEAGVWVAKDFFPMLEQAGVTHVAWVYSPSTFSRLTADMVINTLRANISVRAFDSIQDARLWLNEAGKVLKI
jgi:PAS domain S-box-containing protein